MGNGLRMVLDWQGHAKPVEKTNEPHYEGRQESLLDVDSRRVYLFSFLVCTSYYTNVHVVAMKWSSSAAYICADPTSPSKEYT